jgi:ribosomal protein L37E
MSCPNEAQHAILERCPDCGYSINDREEDYDGDSAETASFI